MENITKVKVLIKIYYILRLNTIKLLDKVAIPDLTDMTYLQTSEISEGIC